MSATGRQAVRGVASLTVDLTDAAAAASVLRRAADTTHVFYASLAPDPDLATRSPAG